MRITLHTDYSLRVLMYLGLMEGRVATIREIADKYGISKNHLMKVVQQLNNKGYVRATRGKNGGLRLGQKPEDINVGALVRDVEQDLTLVECFDGGTGCVLTPACELKRVLGKALAAFFETLDQYTLVDLLPQTRQPELAQLLHIKDNAEDAENVAATVGIAAD